MREKRERIETNRRSGKCCKAAVCFWKSVMRSGTRNKDANQKEKRFERRYKKRVKRKSARQNETIKTERGKRQKRKVTAARRTKFEIGRNPATDKKSKSGRTRGEKTTAGERGQEIV